MWLWLKRSKTGRRQEQQLRASPEKTDGNV
jgi:hypothetical protein